MVKASGGPESGDANKLSSRLYNIYVCSISLLADGKYALSFSVIYIPELGYTTYLHIHIKQKMYTDLPIGIDL